MNNNISKIIVFILITGIMFQGYSIKTYAEERTEINTDELTEQLILYENYENDSFTREDCIVNIMKIIGLNEKKIDKNGIIMGIENNFLDYKERGLHIYDYDYIEYALRIGMIQLETDIKGRGYYLRPYDKAKICEVLTWCIRCLEPSGEECIKELGDYIFTDEEIYKKALKYKLIDETGTQFDMLNMPINVAAYKKIISNLLKCQINLHYADNKLFPEKAGCDLKYDGKTYGEYIILKREGFEARKRYLYLNINGHLYDNSIYPYLFENDRILVNYLGIKNSLYDNLSKEKFNKIIEENSIERYERKFNNNIDDTYVSIREFCAAIGYKVDYEENSNTLILTNLQDEV